MNSVAEPRKDDGAGFCAFDGQSPAAAASPEAAAMEAAQRAALTAILQRRAPRVILAFSEVGSGALARLSDLLACVGQGGLTVIASADWADAPPGSAPLPQAAIPETGLFHCEGDFIRVLGRLRALGVRPDLILLENSGIFSSLVEALDEVSGTALAADLFVFDGDISFVRQAQWSKAAAFERRISHSLLTFSRAHAFFEAAEPQTYGRLYGVAEVTLVDGRLHLTTVASSAMIAETQSTANLLHELFSGSRARVLRKRRLVVQFDDRAMKDLRSIAYGREAGQTDRVALIMDTFFFKSRGFSGLRTAAREGRLPAWSERRRQLFWRGSSTTGVFDPTGPDSPASIPRVALCLALRDVAAADVAIMGVWPDLEHNFGLSPAWIEAWLQERDIRRPSLPMLEHAQYQFLIDIDGVANAWSFIEKLLLGSCVLKIGSPLEQWFYRDLKPWRHFVPVKGDLSDLKEQVDWCLSHPDQARRIAQRGQAFALRHDYDQARKRSWRAVRSVLSKRSIIIRPDRVLAPAPAGRAMKATDEAVLAVSGFHYAEGWGRWSARPDCAVRFRVGPGRALRRIVLDLRAFRLADGQAIPVTCVLDGALLGTAVFRPDADAFSATFSLAQPLAQGDHELWLQTPYCRSPSDVGGSGDERPMGFGLACITVAGG